jgi:hypothetical protein
MQIEVRTIKKMLLKEYEEMYNATYQVVRKGTSADACLEMLRNGYDVGKKCIEQATTYDELDEALSFCGYRMSLQEWLDSY